MDLLSLVAQTTEPGLLDSPWVSAGILIVIVVVSFFLGRVIAKSSQLADHGWKLGVILFCVIFSTFYVGTNYNKMKFGVDLEGGTTFIVDLNLDNDPSKIVDGFMALAEDENAGVTKEEWPQDQLRTFKRIDTNDDEKATREEIQAYYEAEAKEEGKAKESVENVIDQLKKRIDPSGIYEVDLRALGDDQIEITVPGADKSETDRILERIKKAGLLQFRILADLNKHKDVVDAARDQAGNAAIAGRTEVRRNDRVVGRWVNIGRLDAKRSESLGQENRPFRFTIPFSGGEFPVPSCLLRNSATGEIINGAIRIAPPLSKFNGANEDEKAVARKRLLEDPKRRAAYYADWFAKKYQSVDPNAEMQILVVEPPENENVEGQDLIPGLVRQDIDKTGRPAVAFTLKRRGVPKFSKLTGNNQQSALGMILDGELLSAPNINSKIYKNGIIEGDFTSQEVKDLISILKAGQLKTTLQSPDGGGDTIDASLGQEMRSQGYFAIGASFVLILVFLVFYYRIAGIVSCMALLLNLIMIWAIIIMLKQPLTLNGLAGLVLTVGMSVDANVLIFERIREELAKDATLRMAIRNGFQRATTTIVDANITTFITAFILYVIGNEQLKSFSVALMLGIILSMFTAIFCSRVLFDLLEKKRMLKTLGMTKMFTNTKVNFIGKRGLAFGVSIIFIGIGIAAIFARGNTMLNHDLAGGSMARIVLNSQTEVSEIKKKFDKIASENEVNGSPAAISVAMVSSSNYPDNTYYRIVSNIKSDSGSKSLAELITEGEIKDLLARQVVEISDQKTTGTPADNGAAPGNSGGAPPSDKGPEEKGPGENENPCGGEDLFQDDDSTDTSGDDQSGDDPQDGTKQGDEDVNRTSEFEGTGTEQSSESTSIAGKYVTTAKIRFGLSLKDSTFKKKSASLKSDFEEAAKASKFPQYGRNNIKVRDAEVEGSGFIPDGINYEASVFEVEITTNGSDHGEKILAAMKDKYNDQIFLPQSKEVGERFAQKAWLRALAAMMASLIGIVAYIWIRFQRVSFGLAAVAALIHDVLVVLGAIAVSFWLKDFLGIILIEDFKISLAVIAALLTIIGYSLNDTIVVFDRIREVRGKNPEMNGEMINKSINQTLSRTILTSLTTFIVVGILYGAGGDAIHGFAFALVVGVIVGTYSSIFVASPVLLMLMKGDSDVEEEVEAES